MRKYIKLFLLFCFIAVLSAETALAREVKFEASLDRQEIALGERGQLGLTFYGTRNVPAPDIGNITGLEIRYLGPSTMMTVINGKVSNSITHMYAVLPLKIGKFQLGPFSFTFKGDNYTSNMAFLEVVEERMAPTEKKEEASLEKLNLEDRLFLTLDAGKARAYVNELVPVTVKLYVNRLNVSDIQLPTFEQEGFSKVEFKEPKQYKESLSGLIYDVLEFKTNIFGTKPGDFRLGPAKVKCNVAIKRKTRRSPSGVDDFFEDDFSRDSFFDDFFTRYERYPLELKSQDVQLVISPLPAAARPSGFSGAVGDYQFIFSASPTKVKVGDPITLNMDINGTGNFNTILMPKLENTEGFKVYEPQVKTEANRKNFRLVLIPESADITQTPKAAFSYFDINKKEYKTVSQGPIPIQVEKGRVEAPAQVVGPSPVSPGLEQEELKRDIIYIKTSPGKLVKKGRKVYKNKIFLTLLVVPLLFLISLYIVHERNERLKRDTRYARRLAAYKLGKSAVKTLRHRLKSEDAKGFYEEVFKALQGYLGNRLDLPSAGITSDVVDYTLGPKGIDLQILRKVRDIFDICDQARFASLQVDEFRRKDDLKELEEVINYFERSKL